MMKLTSDNVFWFIYQYNCAVGRPTIIPKRAFEKEFAKPWIAIAPLVNQLEKPDGLIIRRYAFVYYLTEKGLTKATAMSQYMREDVMVAKRFWLEIGQYLVAFYDRMHGIKCLLSILISAAILPSNATTWYVTKNGSDSNTGKSESTAFLTIQKAVNSTVAGDEIQVGQGVYCENVSIDKALTIEGVGGPKKAVIQAKSSGTTVCVTSTASGTLIRGLGITGGTGRRLSSYGSFYAGGLEIAADTIVDTCIIYENKITVEGLGGGIHGSSACDLMITNSLIYGNFAYYTGGAALIENQCNAKFIHCTIVDNTSDRESTEYGTQGGISCSNSGSAEIYDCILWSNSFDQVGVYIPDNTFTGSIKMRTNCVCKGLSGICGLAGSYLMGTKVKILDSILDDDPLFKDGASGNYALSRTSPCVGAASDGTNLGCSIGEVPFGICDIVARQRYPWNGLVDLSFTVTGEVTEKYDVSFVAKELGDGDIAGCKRVGIVFDKFCSARKL